ncbi:MAG: glycosyltransferase family 2 protein [Planctomycetes bacterium]|nr:glycosyltransferase family 2 protein [Planctomycetota bacterium]
MDPSPTASDAPPAPQPARLAIVCPCFNEAPTVARFHAELASVLRGLPEVDARVLFVDDGSSDGTLEVLEGLARQDPQVAVTAFSRNFGHQVAVSAGLELSAGADAVVVLDSDLQHPPAVIPELLARWRAGAEVVLAVRKRTQGASLLKRASSAGFYKLFNRLSETKIREGAADFYLLSGRVREVLASMPERSRFMRGLVAWVGFRRDHVEFDAPERAGGESKYTLRRMLSMALDAVFSFSVTPIRLATRAGLGVVLLGGAYLAYVLVRYFVYEDLVQGWASLISVTMILGGAQLMFIGLIGEYVARGYSESKARPLYVLARPLAGPLWTSPPAADRAHGPHA